MTWTKLYKRVIRGLRRALGPTRGMPPQGKINPTASRTRAMIITPDPTIKDPVIAEDEARGLTAPDPVAISEEAAKIFTRYLEGDQEAAKIVEGWSLKAPDRDTSSGRLPLRATEGYGHAPRAEWPSAGVHDDAQQTHDPYAPESGDFLVTRRGLRCLLGDHDDGSSVSAMYPSGTCLRCGRPV